MLGPEAAPLSAAFLTGRGNEALAGEIWGSQQGQAQGQAQQGRGRGAGGRGAGPAQGRGQGLPEGVEPIRISSNENPMGPGKSALDAIVKMFDQASRYPFNSAPGEGKLAEVIAAKHLTKTDNVTLGAGSQEILKSAMRAFASPFRPLVTAAPTFENCTGMARRWGIPVTEVKVDSAGRLDLEGMLTVVRGAGLVFLNNPNNPTATIVPARAVQDFVERVRRISPDTVILIDEAYHEYVTDPAYETAAPLALSTPNVFVARTFSKAYGMAGVRIGYAVGMTDTIKPLARVKMPYNISVFGIAAAIASLGDARHMAEEKARNTAVRNFTVKTFEDLGGKPTRSEANFLFVDIGRPASEFRAACARQGVNVGRDFPPFEHSHVRVSLGTMDEMRKAADVFREVLRPTAPAAGGR
jgi:histidinol-phosphate aminotransferase